MGETTRLSTLDRSVAGRTAIVTGAASGMGRAEAHLLADEGARVAIVDRSADALGAVRAEIEGAGGSVVAIAADLQDQAAIGNAVAAARGAFGPIDILINNAGVAMPSGVDLPADEYLNAWTTTLDVNLTAQTLLIRECVEDLARNQQGRVLNIASTEGLGATPGMSAYTASKHAVVGLTRAFAVELGRRGITVNAICPGPINTGMTSDIQDEHKAIFARRRVPVGRYGAPEEVAQIALSLVLPAASYLNGAIIPVDGGMICQNV